MDLSNIIGSATVLENFKIGGKEYRTVVLQTDDEQLTLPVTPWKYNVTTDQNNKTFDILDFGETLIFGNAKIKKIKFGCFFPDLNHEYSFVVGDTKEPAECVDLITKWKEGKTPVRLIITESPVNIMVAIDAFDFNEKDGTRDIYYKLELSEYRQINIPPSNFTRQSDQLTGLKDRSTSGLNSLLQSSWINNWASDALERSKFAYGNFSSLDTFKSKNSLSKLGSFKIGGWSW